MKKNALKIALLLLLIMIFLPSAGCGSPDHAAADKPPLNVIATIYPLADITRQLGGDLVEVIYLLPAGSSPHTYEPTVEQARLVSEAHLFVYAGAGLDNWGAELAVAAGSDLNLLDLSASVNLLQEGASPPAALEDGKEASTSETRPANSQGEETGHEHRHGFFNPHYWLDPVLVRDQVCPRIFQELVSLLPDEEAYLKERYDNYCDQLTILHEEIEEAVASFSSSKFITFHSAWQYFAARYNLEQAAVIAGSPGQEPSAGWLVALVELIEREQIKAVFAEPQFSLDLAERIAEEGGIEVFVLDPLGGENISGRDTYLSLMRYNLAVFREALD